MISAIIKKKIKEMLAEDIGTGDVTSNSLINPKIRAASEIVAKENGVLAGAQEAAAVFKEVGVKVRPILTDGADISAGDVIMRAEGQAIKILAAERVALNLLMRMSGIATATRELIKRAKMRNPYVVISATRKTAPLLTYFDKQAVIAAGGSPHRYRLSDQILIKDDHIKIVGSIAEAIRRAKKFGRRGKIEVETTTPEEALEAARASADIVMFDNMKPKEIVRAIKMLKREGLRERVSLEASGGITPDNIGVYAATGVDVISSSYMTMRAPAIDFGMTVRGKGFKLTYAKRSG